MTPLLIAIPIAALLAWALFKARKAHLFIWLPSHARGNWAGKREAPRLDLEPAHILLCIADHYEPAVNNPGAEAERARVAEWLKRYPETFSRFRDSDGRPPRHTFFYPAEQYQGDHLERLAEIVRGGYGEVEVHLHHDRDTSAALRDTLLKFAGQLRGHGHLGSAKPGSAPRFGFVHGNWALDNSLPDGRWCGVNDELRVLAECGCYADFTLPAAPSPAQTRRINSIYYAADDPARPRSHDDGIEVRAGGTPSGDLMILQGPLSIIRRPGRLLPRVENGNLDARVALAPARLAAWVRTRVCVAGRPDWVFVKLYTHGCVERNLKFFFGGPMADLHTWLRELYNDRRRYLLHYVTAREMYNMVRAAERGLTGNPGEYRDLEIGPPPCAGAPLQSRSA